MAVYSINQHLLDIISREEHFFKSIEQAPDPADHVDYPVEVLTSLEPSFLPAHILQLKMGAAIMLIQNMVPTKQCNGIHPLITPLTSNPIQA